MWVRFPLRPPISPVFFAKKVCTTNSRFLLLLTLEENSYNHSNRSAMSTLIQSVVVYRRPGGEIVYREVTSNVIQTVAMLQAQGCIIIDIIDL